MTRSYEPDRDALLLAAYLDGRLDEAEAAELEALIAGDGEALEALVGARAALSARAEAAPASLIARAKAIVHASVKHEKVSGRANRGLVRFLKPALVSGAVTAAFLIAAVGAFEAGRISIDSAEAYQALTSDILLPNPSGGLEG